MTCIAGYVKGKDVYMGGDSWFGDWWSHSITKTPKVRPYAVPGLDSPVLVGVTGTVRVVSILDRMDFPPMISDQRRWVEGEFVDKLRTAMWAAGYIKWEDGFEQMPEPIALMMGFGGNLYIIEDNYQATQFGQAYMAIGAGVWHAEGAFAAMEQLKQAIAPKRRVEIALKAAAAHSPYVAPPFAIYRTG